MNRKEKELLDSLLSDDADNELKEFSGLDAPNRDNNYQLLKGIMIKCSWCGKAIRYEDSHEVITENCVGRNEHTISSGFPTGVRVKQVNKRMLLTENYLCDDCYNKYKNGKKKGNLWKILLYVLGGVGLATIIALAATHVIGEGFMFIAILVAAVFLLRDVL